MKSYVREISVDNSGRVTGVIYFDAQKREVRQKAKAVILSANAAESARLLLMSKSARFPDGLANSSGVVGKYVMFGNGASASALFEHPLNEYKGVISGAAIVDYVPSDPKRGFYGGGRMTARGYLTPFELGLDGLSPDAPRWGAGYKKALQEEANHRMTITLFRHAVAARDEPRRSGPRREGRLGSAGHAHHVVAASRRHKEHGVLPPEVDRGSGSGRSEEGLGASGRRQPRRRAQPRHLPDGERSQDVGGRQVSTRPTMCRTCSSWTAAILSPAAAITPP